MGQIESYCAVDLFERKYGKGALNAFRRSAAPKGVHYRVKRDARPCNAISSFLLLDIFFAHNCPVVQVSPTRANRAAIVTCPADSRRQAFVDAGHAFGQREHVVNDRVADVVVEITRLTDYLRGR